MSKVSIQQLGIRLSGIDILSGLDLQIAEGEFLVLLGPSGCGKSTLLHSIAGLIDVTEGRLEIGGKDVTWADPKDRGIGMVFQSYALYPTMTVEKNMSFGLRMAGVPRDQIQQRVGEAARMLQLDRMLARKPSQLSGGQRQRVAIGRALVRESRVLLFDEPLSNLDAQLRSELRRDLKQLHRRLGATMIYVTHDQVEAMTLATRIAVMQAGRIQQIDTPAQVYDRPSNMFVAGFLGAPPMNFIKGRLEEEGQRLLFIGEGLSLDVSGYSFIARHSINRQAVVLGIRPEDIELARAEPGLPSQGKVSLVEPLGASEIVWVETQGVTIGVLSDRRFAVQADDAVALKAAPHKASLFDATTQLRL